MRVIAAHTGGATMIAGKTVRFFGNFAASDPLKFADMVRRHVIERLAKAPEGIATVRFRGINYEIDMSMHRLMQKYFFRTHEMFLERIFDEHLPPGRIFVDIGANCGYWSAYALSCVGREGEVHAFEPVPTYFAYLRRLAEINPGYTMIANNVACGAATARLAMTVVPPRPENFANYNTNIGSSSLIPSILDHARALTESIEVDVIRFDDYLRSRALDLGRIGLIKVDVEGFEGAVFDGMPDTLAKPGRKVPILCEILTNRAQPEPLDGAAIIARLERFGYRCLNATNLKPIDRNALGFEENILCL